MNATDDPRTSKRMPSRAPRRQAGSSHGSRPARRGDIDPLHANTRPTGENDCGNDPAMPMNDASLGPDPKPREQSSFTPPFKGM